MSFELRDDTVGIWCLFGGDKDLMLCMNPSKEHPGALELVYRFRYYDKADPGNDPHSGKDRKSWEARLTKESIPNAIKHVRDTLDIMIKAGFGPGPYEELLNTTQNAKDFTELLLKQPYMHARVATPEEVAEYQQEHSNDGAPA